MNRKGTGASYVRRWSERDSHFWTGTGAPRSETRRSRCTRDQGSGHRRSAHTYTQHGHGIVPDGRFLEAIEPCLASARKSQGVGSSWTPPEQRRVGKECSFLLTPYTELK